MENLQKKESILKQFIKFLIPNVLSMLVVAAYSFTDTFVVGKSLGPLGLASIAIGTPVLVLLFSIGFLYGMGGGAMYSIYIGANEKEKARLVYNTSIALAVITGIIIITFGNIFIKNIAMFLGATEDTLNLSIEYLKYIISLSPFIMLDIVTNCFMRSENKPKVAMLATMIGSFSNIILDCLFVLVFNWGMAGASVATCLGSIIAVIINISYSIIKKTNLQFKISKPDFKIVKKVFFNGFSPFILNVSVAVVTYFYVQVSGRIYGDLGIAAFSILLNWNIIFMNLIIGIGQAVQPLLGNNYGAGNSVNLAKLLKYSLVTALIFAIVYLPIGYLGSDALVSVFAKNDANLISLAVVGLKWMMPTYLFMAFTIIISSYYQAIEKPIRSSVISLGRGFVMPIAFLYLFSYIYGGTGIWVSISSAELVMALISIFILMIDKIKEKKNSTDKNK